MFRSAARILPSRLCENSFTNIPPGTEKRFSVRKEMCVIENKFSYFELSVFGAESNLSFDRIINQEGEVGNGVISGLLEVFGTTNLSKDTIIWIRTAPLYRPPDVTYSSIWIRINAKEKSLGRIEENMKVVDFGLAKSVGSPSLIIE